MDLILLSTNCLYYSNINAASGITAVEVCTQQSALAALVSHKLTYNPDYGRLVVHAALQADVARATSAAIPL